MKKIIALALALVMVLGLAVSAFAVNAITLEDPKTDPTELKPITTLPAVDGKDHTFVANKGGDYYFTVNNANLYKNFKVEATGAVTAELVDYDPEVYAPVDGFTYYAMKKVGSNKFYHNAAEEWVTDSSCGEGYTYARACEVVEEYETAKAEGSYYVVAKDTTTLVKVTVEDNYTAAYKTGSVKVSATEKATKKAKEFSFDVISDVVIFRYEDVKDAAELEIALDGTYAGYSDYKTAELGYKSADLTAAIIQGVNPQVVSTTAFRAVEGEDLTYDANENISVTINDVAAGQKGVNFYFNDLKAVNAKGKKIADATKAADKVAEKITFGFPCKTVIASDFEVEITTNTTWFALRELFGRKLEEEDIVTYYVLKDGKLYDKVTVDYKDIDTKETIELTINGKAGDTLGQYTIQLTAPAADETEENPNTGAESMVSVVAAVAVVAVASAAAVSLKK